jgi:hypothetical protein
VRFADRAGTEFFFQAHYLPYVKNQIAKDRRAGFNLARWPARLQSQGIT